MKVLGWDLSRAAAPVMNTITSFAQVAVTALYVKTANIWRDNYNPLRGLNMRRAVSLLEEGEQGAMANLQWTYRFIEKRDPVLRGGKRSLIAAIEEMDWNIKQVPESELPEGYTKVHSEKQAKRLRKAYNAIDNLTAAFGFLALAEFRGFAHLEKHFTKGGINDGEVKHLEIVPQWHWCREGLNGPWQYNADASGGRTRGTAIDPANFIIREIDDPINEIALIAFVRKNLSQKDWDGFIESFGIPSIFAIMPQNVPSGKEEEYQALAEKVISDSRGALPHGADIKTVDAGQRGGAPFKEHLDFQNELIVMAITSGMLTMLAESGSGQLAGGAHTDTFKRISRALAQRISETFQTQFDKDILATDFPDEPVLAYFDLAAEEEQDTGAFIDGVQKLSSSGLQPDPGQIEEKTGIKVTIKPQPVSPTASVFNRTSRPFLRNRSIPDVDPKLLAQARLDLGGAVFQDIKPILEEFGRLVASTPDADLVSAVKAFSDDLPKKLKEMNIDPSSVEILKNYIGTSVVDGLSTGQKS